MEPKITPLWALLIRIDILWITIGIFVILVIATGIGMSLQASGIGLWAKRDKGVDERTENFLVSGTLLLLSLLLAFTFNLALERYEERRLLVIDEANAIGTAYLRAQILDEPHRTRLSDLLVIYTENRIELGHAKVNRGPLLARSDQILTNLWAAVKAGNDAAKDKGMSTVYYWAFNDVLNLDTERKSARLARIPEPVLVAVLVVSILSAIVVGSVIYGAPQRMRAAIFLTLLTISLCLIIDLNRPAAGLIVEPQEPLELLLASMKSTPPSAFDQMG